RAQLDSIQTIPMSRPILRSLHCHHYQFRLLPLPVLFPYTTLFRSIMSLLFAERPLVINTQLAMKIGLNEAIVLQQLHYWLRDTNSGMECDGVRWIYNTTEQW